MISIEDSTSKPVITIEATLPSQSVRVEGYSTTAVTVRQPSVYDIEPNWDNVANAGWILLIAVLLIPRVFNLGSAIGFIIGGFAFAASVIASWFLILTA
jgi:hypothetical protein